MPEFLRLDSVGEDSAIKHSVGDNQAHKPVVSNKPLFSFRTNRFLSQSNMASVKLKSLNQCPSQSHYSSQHMSFTKAHSFSGDSESQTKSCSCFSRKILSSSFDFSHRGLVHVNMLQLATTARTPRGLLSGPHSLSVSMEKAMLTTSDTCVDTVLAEKQTPMLPLNINPSDFSAADVSGLFTQPQWSSNSDINFQSKLTFSENSVQDKVNSHSADVFEPVTSSSTAENIAASNCNVAGSENVAVESKHLSLDYENLSHLTFDSNLNGHISSSSDGENCMRETISTMDDSRSPCTIKSVSNLAQILSSPRKNSKKGRPSSKKQKKRQREKRKHGSPPLLTKPICSPSQNEKEQWNSDSLSIEFESNSLDELDNSSHSSWASPLKSQNACKKVSTPVKAPSKYCSIGQFFLRPNSSSEEVDDEDDGSIENNEWSENERKGICISPIKGYAFNFALNLDSLFKQKSIPSLRSVLSGRNVEDNETDLALSAASSVDSHCRSLSHSLSEDDSVEDSVIEFCASPNTSEFASCGFATGLSLDILFPTKSSSKGQNAKHCSETANNLVGGPLSCNSRFLPLDHEADVETLKRINAKWNEYYSSAGFRCCHPVSVDEIKDPNIKVHFATEPYLVTVHVVGTEERGGTWHHFALDRERFERRIMEVGRIVSPVLEDVHRAKILQNRQGLKEEQ